MAKKGTYEGRRSCTIALDKVMEKLEVQISADAIIKLLKGEKVTYSTSQKPLLEVEIALAKTEVVQDYYQAQLFIDQHWEN